MAIEMLRDVLIQVWRNNEHSLAVIEIGFVLNFG